MSNLAVDNLTNQDIQLCKAWVNFNGTGTVAIRSAFNVSSITDNGVGNYTVNFTNNMVDNNYVWSSSILSTITLARVVQERLSVLRTVSALGLNVVASSDGQSEQDVTTVSIIVQGN